MADRIWLSKRLWHSAGAGCKPQESETVDTDLKYHES